MTFLSKIRINNCPIIINNFGFRVSGIIDLALLLETIKEIKEKYIEVVLGNSMIDLGYKSKNYDRRLDIVILTE